MPPYIAVGETALLDAGRIVAVVSRRSAPVQRMIRSLPPERILNLSYGYARRSVVLFDNGMVALSSLAVETLRDLLRERLEVLDVEPE